MGLGLKLELGFGLRLGLGLGLRLGLGLGSRLGLGLGLRLGLGLGLEPCAASKESSHLILNPNRTLLFKFVTLVMGKFN